MAPFYVVFPFASLFFCWISEFDIRQKILTYFLDFHGNVVLPAALITPPIHFPAASKNPLQFLSACLHFRLLHLSHLSDIFRLHSAFFSITAFLASWSFFCAASKAAFTAFAASSKACDKMIWQQEVDDISNNYPVKSHGWSSVP